MSSYRIAVIPGDGIGKEVVPEGVTGGRGAATPGNAVVLPLSGQIAAGDPAAASIGSPGANHPDRQWPRGIRRQDAWLGLEGREGWDPGLRIRRLVQVPPSGDHRVEAHGEVDEERPPPAQPEPAPA